MMTSTRGLVSNCLLAGTVFVGLAAAPASAPTQEPQTREPRAGDTGMPAGMGLIVGRVVHGEDSVPVPGAVVYVDGSDAVAVADSSGSYRLLLPPGAWAILTYASGPSSAGNAPAAAPPGIFVTLQEGVVMRADIRLDQAELGGPRNPFALEGVTVLTRSPEEMERRRGGGYVDILDSGFIRSRERAARHIGDVIRGSMQGVRVREREYGYLCIESTRRWPSLREPTAGCRSVAVVLDGMLLGQGATEVLESIPVSDIEEIRYLSSVVAATRYGTAATNGVLVVTTRRGGR